MKEHWYELIKQEFWDAIKIRYNCPFDRIQSQWICGTSFDVTHALSWKNAGLIHGVIILNGSDKS